MWCHISIIITNEWGILGQDLYRLVLGTAKRFFGGANSDGGQDIWRCVIILYRAIAVTVSHHFSREPLRVAHVTVKKHVDRIIRLYEQQKTKKATSEEMAVVLGLYVKRWRRWCGDMCISND